MRGKLWRLLMESYKEIRVRVLHPLIPDTQTEEILRGVPEGSKLSPILFSIFLAELIDHLQTKFPFATTQGNNGQVWIGALAFVDDLVLTSRDPMELQAMINECQMWCEKSRMKINADKTQTMTICPAPASREPLPTLYLTHRFPSLQKHAIERVTTFKYLGVPIDHKLSMTPLKDEIIDKIKKSGGRLQGTFSDIRTSTSGGVSTLGRPSTSPVVRLQLWKSCVLVHATQYLRYITSTTHLQEIQRALNTSLGHAMGCYDCPEALQADLGIPPLMIFRMREWTRMHFRYTAGNLSSPVVAIYSFRTRHAAADNKSAPEPHVLEACKQMFPMWKLGSILPEPTYLRKTAPRNRERSFTRSLNARLSEIWRTQLMSHYPGDDAPKTRMSAYISIAVYDLER